MNSSPTPEDGREGSDHHPGPVVVPIADDLDGTMDEWLADLHRREPRALPRTTVHLLDDARSESSRDRT